MADTKISALTAAAAAADANEFAINEAGTSKKVSLTQVETQIMASPTITSPTFAAGSASASSCPKLSSGTLMTTAEAGALEFNSNTLYATPEAGNRGVWPAVHCLILSADYTLANSGSEQQLFNASTNGTLTLVAGTYFFDCMFMITGLSATSGNGAFDILGAGTAVMGEVLYHVIGMDSSTPATPAINSGSYHQAAQTGTNALSAGTGTGMSAHVSGMFRVGTGGTIIPSITLTTAAAGVVETGSYFSCYSVGSSSVTTVGDWS